MTDEMESVKNQISELEGTLNNLCTKLSEQRKKAAKKLEVLVNRLWLVLILLLLNLKFRLQEKKALEKTDLIMLNLCFNKSGRIC